jgi:hypothetical protein
MLILVIKELRPLCTSSKLRSNICYEPSDSHTGVPHDTNATAARGRKVLSYCDLTLHIPTMVPSTSDHRNP